MTNFQEGRARAALTAMNEQCAMYRHVREILGITDRRRGDWLVDVIRIGDGEDYVIEVEYRAIGRVFGAIVDGEFPRGNQFQLSRDEALLHLVAIRRMGQECAVDAVPRALRVLSPPQYAE